MNICTKSGPKGILHDTPQLPGPLWQRTMWQRCGKGRRAKWILFVWCHLGDYKGGGQIWKDWEISGIGVHDVKYLKNRQKCHVGRVYFSLEFKGILSIIKKRHDVGTWGSWPPCAHSHEADSHEYWSWVQFLLINCRSTSQWNGARHI